MEKLLAIIAIIQQVNGKRLLFGMFSNMLAKVLVLIGIAIIIAIMISVFFIVILINVNIALLASGMSTLLIIIIMSGISLLIIVMFVAVLMWRIRKVRLSPNKLASPLFSTAVDAFDAFIAGLTKD